MLYLQFIYLLTYINRSNNFIINNIQKYLLNDEQ